MKEMERGTGEVKNAQKRKKNTIVGKTEGDRNRLKKKRQKQYTDHSEEN
jgi:hypothetical protein